MKPLVATLFISFLAVTSCSLLGGGDSAPDIPGKIVFAADDEAGTSQIYTMNANGTGVRQRTYFEQGGDAMQPSWSPDGSRIVFSSFEQGTSIGPALWVMDADGSHQQVLYDPDPGNSDVPPLAGNHARWSPDGTRIAFDLCLNCQIATNHDIYLFDIQSKKVTQVTQDSASDTNPTWSPDGRRIAFVSNRDYVNSDIKQYRKDLYSVRTDGVKLLRLTNVGNVDIPNWQPNGNLIAYAWQHEDPDIYLYDSSSNDIAKITNLQYVGRPNWDADGRHLLIPGTNWEGNFLFLYMDMKGKIIQKKPVGVKNMKEMDWFVSLNNN